MRITKLIAAIIGVPMIIGSFALAVGGVLVLTVPDDDGWVTSPAVRLETDSVALAGEDIEIDFGERIANGRTFVSWGEIPAEIEVSSRNGKDVFVGIATQADADEFLSGVAYDRLTSLDGDHDVEHISGAYSVTPPSEADIWIASNSDGVLEWDIRSGDWAIVAVNADGSPGIDVSVTGSAQIPFLTAMGVIFIVLGLIGMTGGTLLTYYGVRKTRPTRPDAAVPMPSATDPNPIVTG